MALTSDAGNSPLSAAEVAEVSAPAVESGGLNGCVKLIGAWINTVPWMCGIF